MKAVFLDTVGILALLDEDDQWHGAAAAAYDKLAAARRRLVTTEAVMWECGNAAARRPYRADVVDLREQLASRHCVLAITDDDVQSAWEEYRHGGPGAAGLIDCLSFAALRRLTIEEVFSNDRHFLTAGFAVLF